MLSPPLPSASRLLPVLPFFLLLLRDACCLPYKFALFYAQLTSAGFPDPVTSLIPHHRPDWLCPAGLLVNSTTRTKTIVKIERPSRQAAKPGAGDGLAGSLE